MNEFLKGILSFIKGMLSNGTPESSKRFFGAIGFLCAIIFIALWKRDLIEVLLFTSASMIGLSAITDIFKAK
jgi:hypothetical protein